MVKFNQLLILMSALFNTKEVTASDKTSWYPKYHVAPPEGWMNDPNGLSYHNGYYHAFFQYNPDSPRPGLMHWGHARSKNMLTWEYLPIALAPSLPEDIDGIFSGSAVDLDGKLALIYTGVSENSTRQRQMVAVSDNDVDFEKLGVVISREGHELNFRDPKAWFQDGNWYVVIGTQTDDLRGEVLLYKSEDFFNWTYEGVLAQADNKLGYMWECPDFFTLDGKQILVINPQGIERDNINYQNLFQTGYFVGTWSPGNEYKIEKEFRVIDHGHDFYASQSFEAPDGRRILIGWLSMWESEFPEKDEGWSGMLTIPRELTLSESGDLEVRPIREIQNKRWQRVSHEPVFISSDTNISRLLDKPIFSSEVQVEFNLTDTTAESFGIQLRSESTPNRGVNIYVDRAESRLVLDRSYPNYEIQDSTRSMDIDLSLPTLSLDIFFDSSSVEVFVNDGKGVMSSRIYPDDDERTLYLFVEKGSLCLNGYDIYDL